MNRIRPVSHRAYTGILFAGRRVAGPFPEESDLVRRVLTILEFQPRIRAVFRNDYDADQRAACDLPSAWAPIVFDEALGAPGDLQLHFDDLTAVLEVGYLEEKRKPKVLARYDAQRTAAVRAGKLFLLATEYDGAFERYGHNLAWLFPELMAPKGTAAQRAAALKLLDPSGPMRSIEDVAAALAADLWGEAPELLGAAKSAVAQLAWERRLDFPITRDGLNAKSMLRAAQDGQLIMPDWIGDLIERQSMGDLLPFVAPLPGAEDIVSTAASSADEAFKAITRMRLAVMDESERHPGLSDGELARRHVDTNGRALKPHQVRHIRRLHAEGGAQNLVYERDGGSRIPEGPRAVAMDLYYRSKCKLKPGQIHDDYRYHQAIDEENTRRQQHNAALAAGESALPMVDPTYKQTWRLISGLPKDTTRDWRRDGRRTPPVGPMCNDPRLVRKVTRAGERGEMDQFDMDIKTWNADGTAVERRVRHLRIQDSYSRAFVSVWPCRGAEATEWDVRMAITMAALDKTAISNRLGTEHAWDMHCVFQLLVCDNQLAFGTLSIAQDAQDLLGMQIIHAAIRQPGMKARIERSERTGNSRMVHARRGTTLSNPQQLGHLDPDEDPEYRFEEFHEDYLAYIIDEAHYSFNTGSLKDLPARAWARSIEEHGAPTQLGRDPRSLRRLEIFGTEIVREGTRVLSANRYSVFNTRFKHRDPAEAPAVAVLRFKRHNVKALYVFDAEGRDRGVADLDMEAFVHQDVVSLDELKAHVAMDPEAARLQRRGRRSTSERRARRAAGQLPSVKVVQLPETVAPAPALPRPKTPKALPAPRWLS